MVSACVSVGAGGGWPAVSACTAVPSRGPAGSPEARVSGRDVSGPTATRDARMARARSMAGSGPVHASMSARTRSGMVGVATAVPSGSRNGRTTSSVRSAGAPVPRERTMAHSTCRGSTSAWEWALAAATASSAMRSAKAIYWSVYRLPPNLSWTTSSRPSAVEATSATAPHSSSRSR